MDYVTVDYLTVTYLTEHDLSGDFLEAGKLAEDGLGGGEWCKPHRSGGGVRRAGLWGGGGVGLEGNTRMANPISTSMPRKTPTLSLIHI